MLNQKSMKVCTLVFCKLHFCGFLFVTFVRSKKHVCRYEGLKPYVCSECPSVSIQAVNWEKTLALRLQTFLLLFVSKKIPMQV